MIQAGPPSGGWGLDERHPHLRRLILADHEFEHAASHVQDAPGEASPQHFHLRAGLDAHGVEALAQGGMAGEGKETKPLAFPGSAEGHGIALRIKGEHKSHF